MGTSDLQDNWTPEELKAWRESIKFTRRDADAIRSLSQWRCPYCIPGVDNCWHKPDEPQDRCKRIEVYPGHYVDYDTMTRCSYCGRFNKAGEMCIRQTDRRYLICLACYNEFEAMRQELYRNPNTIPDVSL